MFRGEHEVGVCVPGRDSFDGDGFGFLPAGEAIKQVAYTLSTACIVSQQLKLVSHDDLLSKAGDLSGVRKCEGGFQHHRNGSPSPLTCIP